jgi:hypothetical protein
VEVGTVTEQPAGRLLSLWAATGGADTYAPLDSDVDVDIAVLGGGIAGLTAALALKRAGLTVAVLEAARVGTGVTGNTTGKVTSLHRLAYSELAARHGVHAAGVYGQANEAAIEHVAGVVAAERIECGFRRVANYTYAESGRALALVREEAALADRLGLPASYTTDVPLPFAVRGSGTTACSPGDATHTAPISSRAGARLLRWTQPLSAWRSRCAPS